VSVIYYFATALTAITITVVDPATAKLGRILRERKSAVVMAYTIALFVANCIMVLDLLDLIFLFIPLNVAKLVLQAYSFR